MFDTIDKIRFISSAQQESPFLRQGFNIRVLGVGGTLPARTHSLKQVHGTELIAAKEGLTDEPNHAIQGDGIFSTNKGQLLAIKTADCLPLVIASRCGSFVSVVHAGWRGLCKGIVKKAYKLAAEFSATQDLFAFFGPCIGLAAFEVGPEVLEAFMCQDCLTSKQLAFAASRGKNDRWHLDLAMLGAFELINSGFLSENITILRSCTYSHPDLWNSYRRSGASNPSNWTIAWI